MDRLSPEVLHIICSFLPIDDVLNFRVVNSAFAHIGAAYMLPDVYFYLHGQELERLKQISAHTSFAQYVKSLTFCMNTIEQQKVPYQVFQRDVLSPRYAQRLPARLRGRDFPPALVQKEYERYTKEWAEQDALIKQELDITCLIEILPRFRNLERLTVTHGRPCQERKATRIRPLPFDEMIRPTSYLEPQGSRHLQALLTANAQVGCTLRSFRAGPIHWKFFDRSESELSRLFKPLENLQQLELRIVDKEPAFGLPVGVEAGGTDSELCRKLFETGFLQKLLKPMEHLRVLSIAFGTGGSEIEGLNTAIALQDPAEPNHSWPRLEELKLESIACDRQDLMKLLLKHKETLKRVCLCDVILKETSWKKLLPEMRSKLYLQNVCICGEIFGVSEEEDELPFDQHWLGLNQDHEHWYLSMPGFGRNRMRDSVNMYCSYGGEKYPDELPLCKHVVAKHYDLFVRNSGVCVADDASTDEDGWLEDDTSALEAMFPDTDDYYDLYDEEWLDPFDGIGIGLDVYDIFYHVGHYLSNPTEGYSDEEHDAESSTGNNDEANHEHLERTDGNGSERENNVQ